MEQAGFYEMMLDNLADGIYILDGRGNYIFVNSAYVHKLGVSKDFLLKSNVYDFVKDGQINVSISDIVYREKRRVVMFQDVYDPHNYGRGCFRQLVVSTPLFDESGEIRNVLAVVRPLDIMNDLYYEAGKSERVSVARFSESQKPLDDEIIAVSPAMRNVLVMAEMVAGVDSAVMIYGESGTGKEVIARYLHKAGERREGPFIVINCAALPENLLEAELFGYEKGAFTGASVNGKKGLFELAAGGTLFLDEINSMPLSLQGKLLRALETKTIQRLGAGKSIHVDFRLISATNESLEKLVEQKRFRIDLYYRLSVVPLFLPPIRERTEDILPLARYFLHYYCKKYRKSKLFSEKTCRNMLAYAWPGNVRELKNFVERSVVMSMDEVIEIENIAGITNTYQGGSERNRAALKVFRAQEREKDQQFEQMIEEGLSLKDYMAQCEEKYVRYVLERFPNSYKAAEILGTSQASVIRRKQKYHL